MRPTEHIASAAGLETDVVVESHRASLRVLSGFAFGDLEADAGSASALAEFDQSFAAAFGRSVALLVFPFIL